MQPPKIKDVMAYLETLAPPSYQEAYDNSGLLVGDSNADVTGVMVTVDCTEQVVEEALEMKSNLIVAHHPILFKGIKKLTGQTYVERTVIAAVRNNVALYAAHTNLDNVTSGVNKKIAERIGLKNTRVLLPQKRTLSKLVTFVPKENLEKVMEALYSAGAGQIGHYKKCSFQIPGTGTFQPTAEARPFVGNQGRLEVVEEIRVEVIFPSYQEKAILSALRGSHPYEEVAYYLSLVANEHQEVGAGLVGDLEAPEEPIQFMRRLKEQMKATVIRHTKLLEKPVSRVALCGGAGSFLLQEAITHGADFYVSADFKYHEFFDAEDKITIADIGHYESEQFTKDLFKEVLSKKFSTFAINFSKTDTNPISYL